MALLLRLRQCRSVRAQPEVNQPVDHQDDSDLRYLMPTCRKWELVLQHQQQDRKWEQDI